MACLEDKRISGASGAAANRALVASEAHRGAQASDPVEEPKLDLYSLIRSFVGRYQREHRTETAWREPVIGVARADDPLFAELKKIVTPTHVLPGDLVAGAKSVVAYFVPFAESVAASNRTGEWSSAEWMAAYAETNQMLADLSHHLYEALTSHGYGASNLPPTYNYDEEKLCSDWSHRSAAYIAGVGTFGINHMLITKAGCCGRIGSVVTELELEPTPMLQEELCLFKRNGTCGACMRRCVAHAFTTSGAEVKFDVRACNTQIYEKVYPNRQVPGGDSCGKCMVGVPCSTKSP